LGSFKIFKLQGGEGIRRKGYENVLMKYLEIKNSTTVLKIQLKDIDVPNAEFKFWEVVALYCLHVTGVVTEMYALRAGVMGVGTYFVHVVASGTASYGMHQLVDLKGSELWIGQDSLIQTAGHANSRFYAMLFEYDFNNKISYRPTIPKRGFWGLL